MLLRLTVKNFAIIEDLTVEFNKGMTVLTGETGAGKSLIIDTISLLLGSRADSDMIRYGSTSASILGVFSYDKKLDDIFNKYNLPISNEISIYREIFDNSKNTIKINNHSVSLTILKSIASMLADIHVQNDTYKLFDPDKYLSFIDPIEDYKFYKLLGKYTKDLYDYNIVINEYEKIVKGQKTALDRLEYLEYELNEITSLNLYDDIDIELEDKIAKLSNYDKIHSNLSEAYSNLDAILDNLYTGSKALQKIEEYDSLYQQSTEKLFDSYYIIEEIKNDISSQLNDMDFDEEELNLYIEKLNEINKAKDKYKKSVKELIDYAKDISLQIEMTTNYDNILAITKEKCINSFNKLVDSSKNLTDYRKALAKKLEAGIIKECIDLDLENTKFEIAFNNPDYNDPFNKNIFNDNGVDSVDFLISFNKGEPLKKLYKVASGGEMSRIMLAFKSYFAAKSIVSLMVFDEIDTGVSGVTAKKIANKLYNISLSTQVLCITHLPQVAAIGDNHKKIYKILDNDRTFTQINDLDLNQRIEEIAMMLSGDRMSLYALEHAKALLER
ncbi:MAG: DNA repair protein RecN [Acholeplasmatales bacterium]|nr:DNA repair protein RecN [Acholeplasmatales bacterium]